MNLELYPYQRTGAAFLAKRRRAYLADQMGLGKSAQAVLAARAVGASSMYVVCPAAAVENWHREASLWGFAGDFEAISYSRLIRRAKSVGPKSLVVLDEAHYCKTPSAKRSRAALGLAAKADYAWLLSGTPMPNDPTEFWAPVKYLWPESALALGIRTKQQWMDRFCKTRATHWGPKVYGVRNGGELRGLIKPWFLRRTLDDVGLELPPLRVDISYLPKDRAAEQALAEYEDYDSMPAEQVFTSTLRRLLGRAKAPAIARQIVEELRDKAYEQIVVLYYHKEVRDLLAEQFAKAGVSVTGFGGDTPASQRQEAVDAFQAGKAQVFLAQQSSAGVAITLTAAHEIVLVEPAWTPDDNDQAIKRIHRIGQDKPCRARIFSMPGTVDSALMQTVARKTQMKKEVFGVNGGGVL